MESPESPEQRHRRIVKYYEEELGVAEADIPKFRADWAELYGQREMLRPGACPELPPSGRIDGVAHRIKSDGLGHVTVLPRDESVHMRIVGGDAKRPGHVIGPSA